MTRPGQREKNSKIQDVSVIGAGAWGTALANIAAHNGRQVTLWAREAEVAEAINARHENPIFLPGVALHPSIRATSALAEARTADAVLAACPAQHMRGVVQELALPEGAALVLCAKGVEQGGAALMSEVAAAAAPQARLAVLSGPGFAKDVARLLPTAVTVASPDPALAEALAAALGSPSFRPYSSDDMIGAEIGGAVKNVLAVACGVAEGKGLGEGARAALITRGFAEMARLGLKLGARLETMTGLAGLGDLVLTCVSLSSRNTSLGVELARGRTLAEILAARVSVAEGVFSAPAVVTLARRHGVEMPICAMVAALLAGEIGVDAAIEGLLARPFRSEGV